MQKGIFLYETGKLQCRKIHFESITGNVDRAWSSSAGNIRLFVGLIAGMLPSLFREAGKEGRDSVSYFSMCMAMILIFALLISLELFSVKIVPGFMNPLWQDFFLH